MNKKLFLLSFLFLTVIFPLVTLDLTAASYIGIASNTPIVDPNCSSSTLTAITGQQGTEALGQTFTATETGYIYNVTVKMRVYSGNPTANLVMLIVNLQGDTYPTSVYPDSPVLGTSTAIAASTLSGIFNSYTFHFEQASSTVEVTSGNHYGLYIFGYGATGSLSGSNSVQIGMNSTSSFEGGFLREYNNVWYTTTSGSSYDNDFYFIINGDTQAPPQATPTPSATASTTDISGGIWGTLAPYANLMLPLIIIMAVAIIGGYFGGVWGFLAGLNVAVILIFVIMGTDYMPLWAIILIGVVDASILVIGTQGIGRKKGD